jgi:hypothetical protein
MNKKLNVLVIFVLLSPQAFCDTAVLQSYIQRFSVSDLLAKAEVLRSAKDDRTMNEHIGEFYEYAIRYVLDNYAQMGELAYANNIIHISLNGLVNEDRKESLGILWKLFSEYPDVRTGAEILVALGVLGKGNQTITENINNYLMERNVIFRSGRSVDYSMISACIAAIMELSDSSSYPALFASICAGYPEVISSEAYGALELIHGNLYQFLSGVIENNPPEEKFAAFKAGVNSERLNLWERGQIAELALELALSADDDNIDITAMRYASVSALAGFRWTRANASVIRHYYRVYADFQNDAAAKERLAEAIACLGAVGNSQAALILGMQLGLINARMESAESFDAEITLAIVQALGLIGDNAAFDHLLTVRNLPYPENIKAAAEEAIERLKW